MDVKTYLVKIIIHNFLVILHLLVEFSALLLRSRPFQLNGNNQNLHTRPLGILICDKYGLHCFICIHSLLNCIDSKEHPTLRLCLIIILHSAVRNLPGKTKLIAVSKMLHQIISNPTDCQPKQEDFWLHRRR